MTDQKLNKSNWKDKVNLLAKIQDLYVSTLEKIFKKDERLLFASLKTNN